MPTNNEEEHRPSSQERKLNNTPLSLIFEAPELLPRRQKHRSLTNNRRNSSKLTKDEIKYQRFVYDLKKEIKVYMEQCIRESRFDTRGNQSSKTDPSVQLLRATLKSKPVSPTVGSHRVNETETIITSLCKRRDPMSFLRYNENKRRAADVQTILAGPAMKNFYTHFIRPKPRQQKPTFIEESILYVSEQEQTN